MRAFEALEFKKEVNYVNALSEKLNDDIHCHVVTVSLHDQNHTNS